MKASLSSKGPRKSLAKLALVPLLAACAASSQERLLLPGSLSRVEVGETGLTDLLHLLGPATVFLASEHGEGGRSPGDEIVAEYNNEVVLAGARFDRTQFYIDQPSLRVTAAVLFTADPLSPDALVGDFGAYLIVTCHPAELDDELELSLVRGEGAHEVEVVVFDGGRVVAEALVTGGHSLRFGLATKDAAACP